MLLPGYLPLLRHPSLRPTPGRLCCSSGWPRPFFLQVILEKPLKANLPAMNFLFQNNEG